MLVRFNNESLDTTSEVLASLLEEKGLLEKQGIAVAVNQEVIPKAAWKDIRLNEQDDILVITATQGG